MRKTGKNRNDNPQSLQVIVTVSGGVADVLFKSPGVAVAIYDYDVEGSDAGEPGVSRDSDGQLCTIAEWQAGEQVAANPHWPTVKQGLSASYCRIWRCGSCARTVEHSYEALAEVGTPICSDCDIEMELL